MEIMVCGFAFDVREEYVLLVKKNHPDWQKGYLNGVGGKVEDIESIDEAMIREFKEETGIETIKDDWTRTVTIKVGDKAVIHFYQMVTDIDILRKINFEKNDVGEELRLIRVSMLDTHNVIPNLKWLIPLSMGAHIQDEWAYDYPIIVKEINVGGFVGEALEEWKKKKDSVSLSKPQE